MPLACLPPPSWPPIPPGRSAEGDGGLRRDPCSLLVPSRGLVEVSVEEHPAHARVLHTIPGHASGA
eukprot:8661535-Heterocapsa_arctica.AAC.1